MYTAPLLGGDAGVEQTIYKLRSLVDDAWKDSFVNRTAIDILRSAGARQYDAWGQIRAIYNWVHESFYFVNDPVTKEALRPTRDLLQMLAGDCDDINANVLPALLGTIGYETRFVTIAADPETPDSFTHIYVEVFVNGKWFPLDAANPGAQFGVAPPNFFRRAWWSTTDDSHGDYPSPQSGTMAGYRRSGVRGLGDLPSEMSNFLARSAGVMRSVNGQAVMPVATNVLGPGGLSTVSPGISTVPVVSPTTEIAVLLIAIGAIWWMSK